MKVATAEQMQELDRKSIEVFKIPSIVLMENAGRGATEAILNAAGSGVEALVAVWRWLPALFGVALVAFLLGTSLAGAAASRAYAGLWLALALAFPLVDLYAYGLVLDRTYNATVPREQIVHPPASLSFLAQDPGLFRLYTKEEIVPALSVMRESYYPDLALTYGLASANLYMPLVPRWYDAYLRDLTPEKLNRLNARYYLIPQLLPVDAASELYDVQNPLAALPVNRWLELPAAIDLSGLQIESYLSHAAQLPNGDLAAEFVLRDVSGAETVVPLRVGLDTAEWAYERDDVRATIAHSMPEMATTWPARSGFPPRDHPGHTYRARITLPKPLHLAAVLLRPVLPEAYVRVERVRLFAPSGKECLLSHELGLGDHSIVYRSEDVLIYRNEDVLPRAYTLRASAVRLDGRNLTFPPSLTADVVGPAEVSSYQDTRVVLQVRMEAAGYLVLADMDYPGWQAALDGAPVPLLCADGVFRALALPPGDHQVTFTYRPAFGLPGD